MPSFLSPTSCSVIRLVLSSLVVSGSTPSRVESRNVPPSTMSLSFCGPSLLRLNSLRITSSLSVSICLSIESELASSCARVTGTSVRPIAKVPPSSRNGALPLPPSKSMYCSPAADSPATRALLDSDSFTDEFSRICALTPSGTSESCSTLPIGTPRRVTS